MSFVNGNKLLKKTGKYLKPNESRVLNIDKHKVLVKRLEKPSSLYNPVYTATYINKDGSHGRSFTSEGSSHLAVSKALKNNGIETRYSKKTKKFMDM